MSFLNPILLFGTLAVAVPIVIHLLNKRKFEKVRWAAMRFLLASIQQNQRRLKLEDLLLLLLRCALVLLIAFALARPALSGAGATAGLFGRSGVAAMLVLDNSYSMGLSDGATTRFENAKLAIEAALDALPANSSAAVLLAGDGVDAVIPEPSLDLNLARKTIREAKLSDRAGNVLPAVRTAIDTLKKRPTGRREVYLATDGQAYGWRQMEAVTATLTAAKDDVATTLLFVGPKAEGNLAVSELRPATGLPAVGRPLRFEARVTNTGTADATAVRVRLFIDDEAAPSDDATIDRLPAGGTRSVSLFAKLREAGAHTVTAALDPDRLPNDDRRTVAVRAADRVDVLLVDGRTAATPRDGDLFYAASALATPTSPGTGDPLVRTTAITASDLGAARLNDFGVVMLANVASLPPAATDALTTFVRNGGGLVVFAGPSAEPTARSFYNDDLYATRGLLPASLGEPAGNATDDAAALALGSRNLDHPIAVVWSDPALAAMLADVKVRRRFPLVVDATPSPATAARPAGDAHVILRLSDDTPLAVEHTFGDGRVVLVGTTANTLWTDLPVRPGVFVPMLYRTIGSLLARQDDALNVRVGAALAYRAPRDWLGRDVAVKVPGAKDDAAAVGGSVDLVDDLAVLRAPKTNVAGAYAARVATDPPTTLAFAAGFDAAESDLRELSQEQQTALASVATVVQWSPGGASLEATAAAARTGFELWFPLAVAALIVAAAETFCAHWFARSR